jgi:hypothetical protein
MAVPGKKIPNTKSPLTENLGVPEKILGDLVKNS